MPASKVKFSPLTGIRFFLALWVIFFHQTAPNGYLGSSIPHLPTALLYLFRSGFLAVGFFFVLSGFVLSCNYSLERPWNAAELSRFAFARFARIYPAYCIGLILVAPFVAKATVINFTATGLGKESVVALLNWTLLQSWFPQTALSWNPPGWSLSNEAFFYCCFPFLGVAIWKISRVRSLLIAASIIWLAALLGPVLAEMHTPVTLSQAQSYSRSPAVNTFWTLFLFYNPLFRLPEFCLGIVCGRVYDKLRVADSYMSGRGHWLYVPGMLVELFIIGCSDSLPSPLIQNALLPPIHSLVILGLALAGGALARLLSAQPAVFLGNASYSMYILHLPVAMWMNALSGRLLSTKLDGSGAMALYVLVVVFLSAGLFKVVEEPANPVLKRRLMSLYESIRKKSASVAAFGF
jgi:peptidoglycan/LPS O-acetylase OafA/YrhL